MHLINRLERAIAKKAIKDLLAAGYLITVCDGEEDTLIDSTNPSAIYNAMFTTDEDYLLVIKKCGDTTEQGWVRFIYGNSGWDVINDYTVNLEDALKATNTLAEKYDRLFS